MFQDLNEMWTTAVTAFDVLLVAFVVYRIYVLLSRTRAVQILFVFGLIVLLKVFADAYGLQTVSWLTTNIVPVLGIGLIVILQPELRRMLSEMGRLPFFQWFAPPPEVPLENIVKAVKSMAGTRTGSIIIILRDIRPQEIIDSAVPVGSAITSEILETIFWKDTPLHDGAVVIEGNRIVAASCYLPMSHSRDIKKTYGARHRAALGFAEESDAVIIVTSEETGRITLMKDGQMFTPIKPTELQRILEELLRYKGLKETIEGLGSRARMIVGDENSAARESDEDDDSDDDSDVVNESPRDTPEKTPAADEESR